MARRIMSNSKRSKSKSYKPPREFTPKEMKEQGILTYDELVAMFKEEKTDQTPKQEMKSIDEYVWED